MEDQDMSKGHKRHHLLLKQQIRLRKRKTPEGKDRYEIVPVPDVLSFEKGFFLFIRAVQLLAQVCPLCASCTGSQRSALQSSDFHELPRWTFARIGPVVRWS